MSERHDMPETMPEPDTAPSPHWLAHPRTVALLWRYGIVVLLGLTALDFVIEPHPHFGLDGTFGFYSWFGFATCGAMVVGAKLLGLFLKRPDTYYTAMTEDDAS